MIVVSIAMIRIAENTASSRPFSLDREVKPDTGEDQSDFASRNHTYAKIKAQSFRLESKKEDSA